MLTSNRWLAVAVERGLRKFFQVLRARRLDWTDQDQRFFARGPALLRLKSSFDVSSSALTASFLNARRHNASTKTQCRSRRGTRESDPAWRERRPDAELIGGLRAELIKHFRVRLHQAQKIFCFEEAERSEVRAGFREAIEFVRAAVP